jgi:Plasma-membrane choline transporter
MEVFTVVWYVWAVGVLNALGQTCVSGSITRWYFRKNKQVQLFYLGKSYNPSAACSL